MPQDPIVLNGNYSSAGRGITLTVDIGNQQDGYSQVTADGVTAFTGKQVKQLAIPAGTAKLAITTYVTAVNQNTNNLIVTYTLGGGANGQKAFTSKGTAPTLGGSQEFDTSFNLS